MRKIKYPLIVSDFDGTLVNADGTITKENKQAIAAYIEAGGIFAISTGRLPSGILPRAKELGLQGLVCCCQGSIILDIQTEEVLLAGKLPQKSTVAACKRLETLGLHIHAYDLWTFYCNIDDKYLRLYEQLTGTTGNLVTDKPLSQFLEEKGLQAYKLLAMVDPKDCERFMKEMEKDVESYEGCALTRSGDFLLEVVQKEYSKGTAVEFLAKRYGIPIEKTIAVGDQHNDIPMLEKAGLGIAVANADGVLKEYADVVCNCTNEESAIAAIIEKYGFEEEI